VQVRIYQMACGADTIAGKVTQTMTCTVAVCESDSTVAQEDYEWQAVLVLAVLVLEVVGVRRVGWLLTD